EIHVNTTTMSDGIEYQPTAQVVIRSRVKWLDQLDGIPTYQNIQQELTAHTTAWPRFAPPTGLRSRGAPARDELSRIHARPSPDC
ncbi:hypothetical protein AB4144_27440, partial [Rhizobiaceae sp. 2RAB30]